MNDHRDHTSSPDLIGSLVHGLTPVEPVRLGRAVLSVAALQALVVCWSVWWFGLPFVAGERLDDPVFFLFLAALLTGAAASAATMATLAIPGRVAPTPQRLAVLILPLVLATLVVALSPWGGSWRGILAVLLEGFGCTRHTIMVAAPAWIAGLLYLRRLAPLDPLRVGLFCGASALFLAAVAVQMVCPNCDSWHLALSHYVPLLLAMWAAATLSPLVLGAKWPEARADH